MDGIRTANRETYRAYRRDLERSRLASHLRWSILVTISLNTLFVVFDYWVFPQYFGPLLMVRITCNVALFAVRSLLARRRPMLATYVGCFITGWMLLTVIHLSGGVLAGYSPGLMLLFVGIPVLLPVTAGQSAVIVGVLFSAYVGPPLVMADAIDWHTFVLHAGFPFAAGVECVASSALLERFRFSDFEQRLQLERARDELKELDRAKSQFTSNVHHELRTPLSLILSPLDALLSGELGELPHDVRQYLRTARVHSLRLLKLIDNLLDLARSETHHLRVSRRCIDIQSLLLETATGVAPLARRKGIALSTSGLAQTPIVVADREALIKIVLNLVGNALKFTPPGGRVDLGSGPDGSGVRFCVTDTGIGIPPSQLERIFDRFAQVDRSSTRRFEGAGIGLSLVRELVRLHGGSVFARSEGLSRGAHFEVRLPRGEAMTDQDNAFADLPTDGLGPETLCPDAFEADLGFLGDSSVGVQTPVALARRADALGTSVDPAQEPSRLESIPRGEILIVEDNRELRKLLATILSKEFEIREAGNGNEALAALRDRLPELLLTDIMMPELSGVDLCRLLKSNPSTRDVPVVLLTALTDEAARLDALELGADDYVTKPFHPRELLARVRSLARVRRLQTQLERRNLELESALREMDLSRREVELYARAVSHDLRSPLVAAGEAIRVAKLAGGDRRETMISLAAQSLELADRLLTGLRDLMRTMGSPERSQEYSVLSLLKEVQDELRIVSSDDSRFVTISGDCGVVRGQRGKIAHVFRNLLSNAVRHARANPKPAVQVHLDRQGESWTCVVEDNGDGIDPELHSMIFEPFRKGPNSEAVGLGLGLAVVEQIVHHHGGTISVASRVGHGATFSIRLPAMGGV